MSLKQDLLNGSELLGIDSEEYEIVTLKYQEPFKWFKGGFTVECNGKLIAVRQTVESAYKEFKRLYDKFDLVEEKLCT